ncbi:Protein of unknown function (DUF2953) [Salsuginibacillus halophilus]|uniref:DUF2953 family protein n=1 Tax=Salsuginibacillus halophilus TaxID=517424 RepID=A0A2P8HBM9_9BACI|nr:DUF2953 domain-containing protein [Salsuginibacillus halophilus]PSL43630.1 Protein of unknown function (DUF2953) [Salsuginibacillus halophilus]
MGGWTITGAIFLLLIICICAVKVHISIRYKHDKGNDRLQIKFWLFHGWPRYSIDVPVIQTDPDRRGVVFREEKQGTGNMQSEEIKDETLPEAMMQAEMLKAYVEHVQKLHRMILRCLKRIRVYHFSWESAVGVKDAALTAQFTGGLWAVKAYAAGLLSSLTTWQTTPELSVHPKYQQFVSKTDVSCMLSYRIGHAIPVVLYVLRHALEFLRAYKQSKRVKRDKKEDNDE